MGFITMLSRETGTIPYGTRIIEQDRINLSVQVDIGNCSQEAYTPTTDVTALSDDVIWFENNFYIPTGVTSFTFDDNAVAMQGTFDVSWTIEAAPVETQVAYTQVTLVSAISDGVTYSGTHFVVPDGVTEFTFIDDSLTMMGWYEVDTWYIEEYMLLANTDGTGDGEIQDHELALPSGFAMKIHWNDGDISAVTGSGSNEFATQTIEHTYLSSGSYDIKYTGDFGEILTLYVQDENFLTGGDAWVKMPKLKRLTFDSQPMIGNINAWGDVMTDMDVIIAFGTDSTLDISEWANMGSTAWPAVQLQSGTNKSFESVAYINRDGGVMNISWLGMSTSDVENALASFAGDATTKLINAELRLHGDNGPRTESTNGALATLLANGNTVRVNTLYPYTQLTTVSAPSSGVTYNDTHFIIPESVYSFTFTDNGVTRQGILNTGTGAWDFSDI